VVAKQRVLATDQHPVLLQITILRTWCP